MRQTYYFDLNWIPDGLGPATPVAIIAAKTWHKDEKGTVLFGGDCATECEIDELINTMISDLEIVRKVAHERFDRSMQRRRSSI